MAKPIVIDEDAKLYGRVQEGLHLTGYSFARACSHLEVLLKGDRWKFGGRFKDINTFLASVQLDDDIRAAAEKRKRLGKLILDLQPKASIRQIARTLGVDEKTVRNDSASSRKSTNQNKGEKRQTAEKSAAGSELSGADAAKIVQRRMTGVARTQGQRAERERELGGKIIALPDAKFGVIVADPEWHTSAYSEETGMDRHASRHYTTSDNETIKARPVASIAADDCVLFLWATNQHLDVAIDVLRAWGFQYVSNYIWRKPTIGLGYWNRSVHEVLLIGTRGNVPCPALGTQEMSVIDADRGEHSAKPEVFLEMIERYFPTLPKIELNRRGAARSGWSAWGNEVEHEAAE